MFRCFSVACYCMLSFSETCQYMKTTVFCYVTPYSLVDLVRRFRGAYSLHHQDDKS
jgi:hypothetical protein